MRSDFTKAELYQYFYNVRDISREIERLTTKEHYKTVKTFYGATHRHTIIRLAHTLQSNMEWPIIGSCLVTLTTIFIWPL